MTSTFVVTSNQQSDGLHRHTGRLVIGCQLDSGDIVTVTLPDDWQTLLARVAALEAAAAPNSLEDLTYGG